MADVTPDHIERCKEAMTKPAPLKALRLIASGRAIISVRGERGDVLMEEFDGKPVRDPEFPGRKMGLAGAWPLFHAGMIDRFGVITELGWETIIRAEEASHG